MPFERSSGLLLHITSLPSYGGIGDLGPAAYAFADFLAASKQRLWQVLPIGPTRIWQLSLRGSFCVRGQSNACEPRTSFRLGLD